MKYTLIYRYQDSDRILMKRQTRITNLDGQLAASERSYEPTFWRLGFFPCHHWRCGQRPWTDGSLGWQLLNREPDGSWSVLSPTLDSVGTLKGKPLRAYCKALIPFQGSSGYVVTIFEAPGSYDLQNVSRGLQWWLIPKTPFIYNNPRHFVQIDTITTSCENNYPY